jgi:hypothetical protein
MLPTPFRVRPVRRVHARYSDDDHGIAVFVDERETKVAQATVLLEEAPIAASQHLRHRTELKLRSCPRCLAFAHPLDTEIERLLGFVDGELGNSAAAFAEAVREAANSARRYLNTLERVAPGRHLPFPWFPGEGSERCPACFAVLPVVTDDRWDLLIATAADLEEKATLEAGRTNILARDAALDTLRHIAENNDERAAMIAALAVKAFTGRLDLQLAGSEDVCDVRRDSGGPSGCAADTARVRLQRFADQFAHGAFRSLKSEQRKVIRDVAAGLSALLQAECGCPSCTDEVTRSAVVSAQLVLTLRNVLDANLHTCIVINPLWSLLNHLRAAHGSTPAAAEETAGTSLSDTYLLTLETLFARVPSDVAHNAGFALYNWSSRFNHSCVPNAQLVPTVAPVRARTVAMAPIEPLQEVRIAYVDVTKDVIDRRAALAHYGFDCDCELCHEP